MPAAILLDTTVRCPRCQSVLITEGIAWNQPVICALCRTRFTLRPPGFAERTSRMALLSLLLGVTSLVCMCFAGIPAIVFGAVALANISRSAGALTGRRLAIGG